MPDATPPVRFVYFDLDDTLLDHRRAERAALADCHARFGADLGAHDVAGLQATYHAHNAPLWRDYGAGTVTRDELQRLRFSRTLDALGASCNPEVFGAHYLDRYGAYWSWLDGAEDAYHAVADRYPVGLLTNGFIEQQRGKLARFPSLEARAAVVVISEEIGAMKPHPLLFAHAASLTGVAPSEILLVGDSLHSDVEGALAAGWQAAWLTDDPSPAPPGAFAFSAWDELLRWLAC